MIQSATGIILRTRPLTETSLIVHWLTPDLGRISTVAKGARRPKSPFAGKLDIFYQAEFSFTRSQRSELHPLREVKLKSLNATLREDMGWLCQAAYFTRIIEQVTETDTPLAGTFNLLHDVLEAMPKHPPQPQTVFAFELKFLHELGLAPDLDAVKSTPGTRQILGALTTQDWPMIARLKLSAAQVGELKRFLQNFLAINLGKIPQGRPV
jgi:DNA repair protein RecO (recombination protein O)